MSKRFINIRSNHWFNWGYGTSIEEIRKDLDILEKEGANFIEIESDENYLSFEAFIIREETDEKYTLRLQKEKENKELAEFKEYQEYLKLKLKYES